jgi:hypothetical protein
MSRLLWALALLAAAPLACTSDISVFGGGSDGDEGGQGAIGGSSGEGGAGGVSTSVGPTTTTATTIATTTTTATTATTATSTSSGGNTVSIPCTNATCTGTQVCCVHYQSESNDKCAEAGQCGSDYVEVGCNGPMDCDGGEVCCGHWNQQTGYQQVACMASCNSTASYTGITMCGDDPTACQSWQSCNASQFLPTGHSFCQ